MKSLEEFLELFIEQFDETDATEIYPTKKFRELSEWSSIIGLSLIAMIDEEFGIVLKGDDIRTANTPEDLYNIIKSKHNV